MSDLLWVSVPNGLVPGTTKALIRVVVVPRLGDGDVAGFAMADWPATLEAASFVLRVKSSGIIYGEQFSPEYQLKARSEVWHAFFDGEAGVINAWSQKNQLTLDVTETYPDARKVVNSYRTTAVALAEPTAKPPETIRPVLRHWHAATPPPPPTPEQPLPPMPPPDFRKTVALLREHPAVLLDLGLIFELTVEVADLTVGDPTDRYLSIRADPALGVTVTSPWTKYELTSGGFWPAAAAGSTTGIRRGLLDLTDVSTIQPEAHPPPEWAIATFDVDGAVTSLRVAARMLDSEDAQPPTTLPSLRSAGLQLVRPGRQTDFHDRAEAAASRNHVELEDTDLTVDDLVLGYRVDIRSEHDPEWRSLCERDAQYTVREPVTRKLLQLGSGARFREEGHVKPFAAVKADDDTLHADEVVVRWDGWGLALPRINLLGNTPGPLRNLQAELPYEFNWEYHIPEPAGRLPQLRFATAYQMRIRVVDVAGGGPRVDDLKGSTSASNWIRYTRHEPVPPPVLHGDPPFTHGAAVDHLVIRSDDGMTAEEFHAVEPRYPSVERRTLSPPPVSFALAEQHGKFDRVPDELAWERARRALHSDAGAALTPLPDPAARGVNAFAPAEPGGLEHPISDESPWPPWPNHAVKHIELTDAPNDTPISLAWTGVGQSVLSIRLAKAEQATLELSSTLESGLLDHFAIHDWLAEAGLSVDALRNGRHPLLSPPRKVQLVHAVRRPLAEPVWKLPTPDRTEGDTSAILNPTFQPDGLNTDSTGRLEVAATWQEWDDSGHQQETVEHLHGETIARGNPPALTIRHEFGDTKHRNVTYTLTAISRFRQYFNDSDPDDDFRRTRTQSPEVNIRSTARPTAPTVLAVVPAFAWQHNETDARITRVRSSQRLRVKVARPWYETGEGERLAVIAAIGAISDEHGGSVTQLARDPIFATDTVPRFPPAAWFTGHAGGVAEISPPEPQHPVSVIPYQVTPAGDRWHADIAIRPPTQISSYGPFVRLALARYQPDSLPDLRLSPIVGCEPVPLLPDRQLVIERHDGGVRITLTGTQPHPPNRIEAVLETCDLPSGVSVEAVDLVSLDGSPADGIPAWRPLPQHTVNSNGTATLPILPLPTGTNPLRLRIREAERLESVADHAIPAVLRQRTVFVDTIPIPPGWHQP